MIEDKEFNLSDTGTEDLVNGKVMLVFTETRVKEFIKRLKEEFHGLNDEYPFVYKFIDKLAGDKLI